ncbi:DUF4172 domain-containing protein [Flavobacteriales bacterium]|nr:DUF4172 domain-containing protein [Flavobacteriales bacterium]
MKYNWQLIDWKEFSYNKEDLEDELFRFSEKVGVSKGLYESLSKQLKTDSLVEIMSDETINTSAIEGEIFSREDVRSSIHNNLGISSSQVRDKKAQGISDLIFKVRLDYVNPLSKVELFKWHKLVFPGKSNINAGAWRKGDLPMQIISGSIGKEIIHYEAPPSAEVNNEMIEFIDWFNSSAPKGKQEIKFAAIRSAIAHLYFESIHPFEDGNGRIGRAIAEKALFQSLGFPVMVSLSTVLQSNKSVYYNQLKKAQRTNQITEWLNYFIGALTDALDHSHELIKFTLFKARFFDKINTQINDRQRKALYKMLSTPNKKFEGGMTAKKYMSINKISKATATRDLQQLEEMNVFLVEGAGRNTCYQVNKDLE